MKDVLFPSPAALAQIKQQWAQNTYSNDKGYFAPTVYLLKGISNVPGWDYYKSLQDATNRLNYLFKMPGGVNVKAAGTIPLKTDGTAQTVGINTDFYFCYAPGKTIAVPYGFVKLSIADPNAVFGIFRFYKTNGAGPYYGIFNPRCLGIAATVVSGNSAKKAELDELYRQLALLKTKYNTLVSFLNELSKKNLSPVEQRIFNQGILLKDAMMNDIRQIKGIEVYSSTSGQIGFVWIPVIIVLVIIGAITWGVTDVLREREKTQRIQQSYDMEKWIIEQKKAIAADKTISAADKASVYKTLDQAADTAVQTAKDSSSPDSNSIGNMIKWALGAVILLKVIDFVQPARKN